MLRHPQYKGETSPELACKTCCSLFVSRIRTEQKQMTMTEAAIAEAQAKTFKPLVGEPLRAEMNAKPSKVFDSSWI